MLINRRRFLAGASAAGIIRSSKAWTHGSGIAPTRVLVIGYGQSNMGTFITDDPADAPSPNVNSLYYDGYAYGSHTPTNTIISPTGYGSGMLTCLNQINNITGLPVLWVGGPVGGSPISGLTPGNSNWTALVTQINAVIQPSDFVVMLWDQGEGDAATNPHEFPQDYIDNLTLIQQGLASATGRPTVPVLVAGLGTIWGLTGQPNGGNTPRTWQTIRNAHFFSGIQIPYVYYAYTNIDILRASATDFHYVKNVPMGQRFAQGVLKLMGYASVFAHWEATGASIVSSTATNVTVSPTLGTDFTPTTNEDGWEVSGDNGANWAQVSTGSRINATTLQLPHSSLSSTNARLVRYQNGYNQAGSSAGPTPGHLLDNSSLAVPLTPTTWDLRASGGTNLPMPTWRNLDTLTGSFSAWTSRKLLCWPTTDNYQKFILIAVYSGFQIDTVHNLLTLKVQPDVGAQVTATFVCQHPSSNSGAGLAIYQAQLGTDANAAQYLTITGSQPSNPSTGYTCHIYDVNAALLNSTTSTGNNNSTASFAANTAVPISNSCTVNVSAGGFILCMNAVDQTCSTSGGFATYSSNFNERWEDSNHVTLDAANCSASASSSFTISMQPQNTNAMNIYTLMASWR